MTDISNLLIWCWSNVLG